MKPQLPENEVCKTATSFGGERAVQARRVRGCQGRSLQVAIAPVAPESHIWITYAFPSLPAVGLTENGRVTYMACTACSTYSAPLL